MSTIHNGSNFDDFLQEEGLLADVEATAIKRVVAYQIELEMQKSKLSKTALAQKCTQAALHWTGYLIQIMFP